jgi:hypothetical protein
MGWAEGHQASASPAVASRACSTSPVPVSGDFPAQVVERAALAWVYYRTRPQTLVGLSALIG